MMILVIVAVFPAVLFGPGAGAATSNLRKGQAKLTKTQELTNRPIANSPMEKRQESKKVKSLKSKIALVQYPIDGEVAYEKFLSKVEKYVDEAKTKGAELVAFPELLVADLVEAAEKKSSLTIQFQKLAKDVTPKFFSDIKALAKKHQIAILAGSAPRYVNDKIYNTALLAFADGKEVMQDKLFLTPDEKEWGWSGNTQLNVFQAPWGKSVILICYDAEIPGLSHALAKENPEIFLVPSMTDTVEGFRRVRWTAQARAVEHRSYVLHLGTVGDPDPSWPHYGQASALTPNEKGFAGLLKEGLVNTAQVVLVELDLDQLRAARAQNGGIYPVRDQNLTVKEASVTVIRR